MIRLTNKLKLPSPLVRAIENDNYTPGPRKADYSTTGLITPPRIAALRRKHRDELTEDASDRLWALMGQVTHGIIERAATTELAEKRLYMEIAGKVVSGQLDLLEGRILWDFKLTSVYSGKQGPKEDWMQQGNINALLCHENDIAVEAIQYVALYRDWSIMAAMRERHKNYPQQQVEIFNLPIWPLEKTRDFVEERIALHEAAKEVLPECTPEERWAKPTQWAVMERGVKKALRGGLKESEQEAKEMVTKAAAWNEAELAKNPKTKKRKFYLERRPSQSRRCQFFCSVSSFCEQWARIQQEQNIQISDGDDSGGLPI